MDKSLQELLKNYIEQYSLNTGVSMPMPVAPLNTFKSPGRGVSPAGSTPSMQHAPQKRPDLTQKKSSMATKLVEYAEVVKDTPDSGRLSKVSGWVMPAALGAGGATAYFKRKELSALLKRLGIGDDITDEYLRNARYANPRMAQVAQKVIAG